MRIDVMFVLCLSLNAIVAQSTKSKFNCEELSSHVKSVKESTKTKKAKFTCILNPLKNALVDELKTHTNVSNTNITDVNEKETSNCTLARKEENNDTEKELHDKLVLKSTSTEYPDKTWDIPTMIPIFKPNPVRNDVIPEPEKSNFNPKPNNQAFIIPCQRAIDILDMTNEPSEIKNMMSRETNIIQKEGIVEPRDKINDVQISRDQSNDGIPHEVNLQHSDILSDVLRKVCEQPKTYRIVFYAEPQEVNTQPREVNPIPGEIVANAPPREPCVQPGYISCELEPRELNPQPIDKINNVRPEFDQQYHIKNLSFKEENQLLKELFNDVVNIQENLKPSDVAPRNIQKDLQANVDVCAPNINAEIECPKTLAVHVEDGAESIEVLFKPKIVTLTQMYGNLLKKITITVLVPYHMSKIHCDG